MLLDAIILKSVREIKGSRTTSAIYHLLTGKKSIQTVQDAYFFKLDRFYGVFKKLKRKDFNTKVIKLIKRRLLVVKDNNVVLLSSQGGKWLRSQVGLNPLTYLNGMHHNDHGQMFFDRLILMIQVLTNRKMKQSHYIPVLDNRSIVRWVVQTYQQMKYDVDYFLKQLYKDLLHILTFFSEEEASLFVDRLTGYNTYGMSLSQLSQKHTLSKHTVHLTLTSITHRMIDLILQNKSYYQLLNMFIADFSQKRYLSQSAQETELYIESGYTLLEISKLRNLKLNTIYDHIVEITLANPDFSIDAYVTPAEQEAVLNAYRKTKSTKLRTLKETVHQEISYFKIRLVLANLQST